MSDAIGLTTGDEKRIDDAWTAVQTGLHYVSWLAREFRYSGAAREDLEEEGRLGLFEAALRFDPKHGAQFLTYGSWWARRRMQTFVARQSRIVRRPLPRTGGPKEWDEVSLDEPIGPGKAQRWGDVLVDHGATRPLEAIMSEENAALVASLTQDLPPQWRAVIVRRFGLDGGPATTLAEVGGTLGLSRERVRQIETKAMERLRGRIEQAWGRARRAARPASPVDVAAARAQADFRVLGNLSGDGFVPDVAPVVSDF